MVNISLFSPLEGDYTSRAAELARQKKLADMLIEMSQQETPVSTAGGITAPVSPYGALAKALTSFGGSYLSGKAAQDEAALKKEARKEASAALSDLYQPAKTATLPGQEFTLTGPSKEKSLISALKMGDINYNLPATSYEDQQRMLNEYEMSDNPYIAQLAATQRPRIEAERDRIEAERERTMPKYMAGSEYGVYDVNPNSPNFGKPIVNPAPATSKASPLAQLIAERDALPENDPRRTIYDSAIQKETTRAPGVTVQMPRPESSFGAAVGQGLGTQAVAAIEAGKKAPQMIESANRVISILKDPKVTPITGSFADFRLAASKAFYGDNVSAATTENLISDLASSTLDAIPSSGLGTGQGFTQKDKEFLEAAKAGNIGKTKENLIRLAQIRKNIAIASIGKANSTMDVIKNMPGFNNMGQLFTPITYDANSTGLPSSNKSRRRYNPETGNLD